MVEKPLATTVADAERMVALAEKYQIQILTNYETTWYPSNHTVFDLTNEQHAIGDVRKMVVHDGHQGPVEIGCSKYFLEWLTDPVKNGGGAIMDFGCYGADLMTWLMHGEMPVAVTAVTKHIKPNIYPKVDDDATILLEYPKATGIIEASWNWPFDRKDMEIYGRTGYVLVPRPNLLRVRLANKNEETEITPSAISGPEADPISYLAAVVRKEITPSGLSSLSVNMTVVEILDAAHASARTGKRIEFKAKYRSSRK